MTSKALAEKNKQELLIQERHLSDPQVNAGAVGGGISHKPIL